MRPFIVQSQLRKVPGEKRKNYRSLKHLLTMCVGGQILVPLAIQRFEGGNHSPEGIPRSNHCIDIATLDVNVWVGELFPVHSSLPKFEMNGNSNVRLTLFPA
jgi:hypothetical protein